MKKEITSTGIPAQVQGGYSDSQASQSFISTEEAARFYKVVKDRLLHVNNWHSYSGAMTAHFELCNNKGEVVDRTAKKGDHFRINIPGPGTKAGDGYDWVKVVSVTENNSISRDKIAIKVKPCSNPCNNDKSIAHFFTNAASSNFIVIREGDKVTAEVHGRNEMPNTETEHPGDKARNAVIGAVGIGFFSKFQWKKLVNGLVAKEI